MDIAVWLSNDFPVGQRQSFRGGFDKRIDEEIAHCSSTLDDLSSTDQWVGRETEQDTGQHVKGVLLKIHDGLGQIPATGSRSLQQYTALNDGHQSFHDVDGQGESNASDILLPGMRREKDVASGIRDRSDQKTTGVERAMQEEHGASANEATQEIRRKNIKSKAI